MSRLAQHPKPVSATPRKTVASAEDVAGDEVCPVCKSSRYLNANLRFLVNPECWHKMCESCVDRIFSHGPAPCPILKCGKTLRKMRFREQTFEDLQVEREVDIRRRIAAVFNKREDEFEDIRSYNDYLNEVEDITFNLVNNIDVEATNKRLEQYQQAHQEEIAENANLAEEEKVSYTARQKQDKEAARLRREAARREEDEERRALAEDRREILQNLATGDTSGDAEQIARTGQKVQLKRRLDRQAAAERQRQLQAAAEGVGSDNLSKTRIKGLKSRSALAEERPIDPFGGLSFDGQKYYQRQPNYVWEGVQETQKDIVVGAGGYDIGAYENRILCEAFAGLGVFIAEEMTTSAQRHEDASKIGTVGAALTAGTA